MVQDRALYIDGQKCVVCLLLHRGVDVLTLHDVESNALSISMTEVGIHHLQQVLDYILYCKNAKMVDAGKLKHAKLSPERRILEQLDESMDICTKPLIGAYALAAIQNGASQIEGLTNYDLRHIVRAEDHLTRHILDNNSRKYRMNLFSLELVDIDQTLLDKHVLVNYFKLYGQPNPVTRKMMLYFNGLVIRGISADLIMLFGDLHFGA